MGRIDDIVAELRARDTRTSDAGVPKAEVPATQPRSDSHTARARTARSRKASGGASTQSGGKLLPKLVILLGVLVVLVFVVAPLAEKAGATSQGEAKPAPTQTSSAVKSQASVAPRSDMPQPADWKSVIVQLDAVRARALIDGSQVAHEFDDAHGPAYTADIALMKSMRQHGYAVASVPLHVTSVAENYVTQGEAPRASLTVVDAMDAYDVLAKDGTVARHVPARAPVTWTVVLTRSTLWGWRFWSVVRATPASK